MPVFKGKAEALKIQASAKRQEEVEQAAVKLFFFVVKRAALSRYSYF